MIKFFDRDDKWNWVDSNNNFVGYSNDADCCEHYGYHLVDLKNKVILDQDSFLQDSNLVWDTNWIDSDFNVSNLESVNDLDFSLNDDELQIKTFKIKNADNVYLVLYNSHNGYYSHGWEAFGQDGGI
jgi:hypothetical protein